jgi:exodeoxyribonuclease III
MPLSIATWNINSVRKRLCLLEKLVDNHKPDIICLQETKCLNDQFPAKDMARLGYVYQSIHGQKGYHGVATLSRVPLINTTSRIYCDKSDARHTDVAFNYAGMTIRLHNFYVPAGGDIPDPLINEKFAHKLAFLDEMFVHARPQDNEHTILVGDLNIAPHEHDVWSHKQLLDVVSHTPIETSILLRLMNDHGWQDAMRRFTPMDQKLYTWWSYRAQDWQASNRGRRLDHVWTTSMLAESLANIIVLQEARGWEQPSDHVPVIAIFK